MDATRARSWSAEPASAHQKLTYESPHASDHLRWGVAAGLAAAFVLLTLLVVRELRFAPRSFDSNDDAASSTVVPSEAVSVPSLIIAAGHQVHVGESRVDAVAQLESLKLLKRSEEQGPLGAREIRAYQGVTLVFEPFERAGTPRVAAIYLQ
jgi:hypothetical protein